MTAATTIQLRCKSKLHGIKKSWRGQDCIEIRCKDKWCAERGTGTVVLHYFSIDTGELVHTQKFRDPNVGQTSQHDRFDERLNS